MVMILGRTGRASVAQAVQIDGVAIGIDGGGVGVKAVEARASGGVVGDMAAYLPGWAR